MRVRTTIWVDRADLEQLDKQLGSPRFRSYIIRRLLKDFLAGKSKLMIDLEAKPDDDRSESIAAQVEE